MKPLKQAKQEFVRKYLADVLTKVNGHTAQAARITGWSVPNFCKLLRTHGMKAEDYRESKEPSEKALSQNQGLRDDEAAL